MAEMSNKGLPAAAATATTKEMPRSLLEWEIEGAKEMMVKLEGGKMAIWRRYPL
jgi:cell division GTPase FtsZ